MAASASGQERLGKARLMNGVGVVSPSEQDLRQRLIAVGNGYREELLQPAAKPGP